MTGHTDAEASKRRSRWFALRLRVADRTVTIEEYQERIEPLLTRPLTDDPIKRRQWHKKATPERPVR